jgi:hypothetical protein
VLDQHGKKIGTVSLAQFTTCRNTLLTLCAADARVVREDFAQQPPA